MYKLLNLTMILYIMENGRIVKSTDMENCCGLMEVTMKGVLSMMKHLVMGD